MSETVNGVSPPPGAQAREPEQAPLFRAFVERKRKPRLWPWVLVVLAVLGVGAWAVTREQAGALQVATAQGVRTVRRGMSPGEVRDILGRPLTLERSADGLTECYRYGLPTLNEPTFSIYSACYEAGALREVSMRKFEAWELDPGMLPVPAGGTPAPQ